MSFICPDCKRESFNLNDEKHRYCVACNKFFDYGFITDENFARFDSLAALNPGHAAAYATMHFELLRFKQQRQEEEQCMSSQKNSGPHESLREKWLRVWKQFAEAMSRKSS